MKMKYNKSEIMKKAWNLYRYANDTNKTFGECLKLSWYMAKAEVKATEEKAAEAASRETYTGKTVEYKGFEFRFWQGGKNRRIYVNGYHAGGAYIDINTRQAVTSRKTWPDAVQAIESFLNHYEIAC